MPEPVEYTIDTMFGGRICCMQHSGGYRFSVDAVLLGNFINVRPGERVLDLGCGGGIVSFILAYRWSSCLVAGLEIQPELAELARKNVARNNWRERINIVVGDLQQIEEIFPAGRFDVVVSNPPYRKIGTGRVNRDSEQLLARHEATADAGNVVRAAVWSLKTGGRAAFVYPATRAVILLHELKKQGLEPKRMQTVYSYPGGPATLVLVESRKGGGEGLTIMAPFYVYREPKGEYSPEMAACYLP